VLVGPAIGEDGCAVVVPSGVLVATADPVTLTGHDIGRSSVTINANDVAVMGVRPRWFLATVLLPVGTTSGEVQVLFNDVRRGLADVGAVLVGGHTEVTDAVTRPVIAGTMLGVAEQAGFVSIRGARPGNVIIQVGAAPIEGAAVLVAEVAERLGSLSPAIVGAAALGVSYPGISVVEAALAAAQLGATAMHDPTEGGLAAGLHEVAPAAGVALSGPGPGDLVRAGPGRLPRARRRPWAMLASGSLLAMFEPDDAEAAVKSLLARGHAAAVIGTVELGEGVFATGGDAVALPDRDEVARIWPDECRSRGP
jgi:hydrogenase maturation factor